MAQEFRQDEDFPLESPPSIAPVVLPPVPKRRRLPTWWLPATAGVLVLALAATGTWGVVTARDLGAARQTIDQQTQRIAGLQTDLAQEKTRGDGLASSVANLEARVKNQAACISALATDKTILSQIADKETTISNLTAEGSAWATADNARTAAMAAGLDDYYNAYAAAFNGQSSSANTWIGRGNAQVAEATRQTTIANTQIDKANQLIDEVDGMLKDYAAGSDLSVCTATSSGSSS